MQWEEQLGGGGPNAGGAGVLPPDLGSLGHLAVVSGGQTLALLRKTGPPRMGVMVVGAPSVSSPPPWLCGVGCMSPCYFPSLGFPSHAEREGRGAQRMALGLLGRRMTRLVSQVAPLLSKLELKPDPHPITVPLPHPPHHHHCCIWGVVFEASPIALACQKAGLGFSPAGKE